MPSGESSIYWYYHIPFSTQSRNHNQFLAVIQREADLTAPKSFLTQLVRDASNSTNALREAMATTINSPPQSPLSGASPPTSPLQRFFSMAQPVKADKPWKEPEVRSRVRQLFLCLKYLQVMGSNARRRE